MAADDTPTRAQTRAERFAALVIPAAETAGYKGHGAKARLARDTGMSESTVSRIWLGQRLPDPLSYAPLAAVIGLDLQDLLIEAGIVPARSLTETSSSQVRSQTTTPQQAADEWGIRDPHAREMFFGVVERLRRPQQEETPGIDQNGGEAVER